jgi:DNA-binding XRE family transcriptional regulator
MVRERSSRPVAGRPDEIEQQQIAAGVGALLRDLRRDQGMSVRDLEKRSGINRSTISRLERGLRRPRRSVLGWLAWGLSPEAPEPVKRRLVDAAGDSLVAESRWSERSKGRRADRRMMLGGMPVPMAMLAPYAVAALGPVIPDDLDRLRQVQEMAGRGEVPWPDGLTGSVEALAVAGTLASARPRQLAAIGRTTADTLDYPAFRARRQKQRARRAAERQAYAAARGRRRGRDGSVLGAALALARESDAVLAADRELRRRHP